MSYAGIDIFRQLKTGFDRAQSELVSVKNKAVAFEQRMQELDEARKSLTLQLAKEYLPEFDTASINQTATNLQGELRYLFNEKALTKKELEGKLFAVLESRKQLVEQLDPIAEQLSAYAEKRDELEELLEAEVAKLPDLAALQERVEKESEKLERYYARLDELTQEAKEKLPEYQVDPLFMYLVDQHYKDSSYKVSGLRKWLDSWVAKIVKYEDSKRSYDFLTIIPELVSIEIEKNASELEVLVTSFDEQRKLIADKLGLTEVIEAGTELGAKRDSVMEQIATLDSQAEQFRKEREQLESETGEYYHKALELITSYLDNSSFKQLWHDVSQTQQYQDDELVAQLEEITSKCHALKEDASQMRRRRSLSERAVTILSSLQRRFTESDFESRRSQFSDRLDIESLLSGVLEGVIGERDAWGALRKTQQFIRTRHPRYSSIPFNTGMLADMMQQVLIYGGGMSGGNARARRTRPLGSVIRGGRNRSVFGSTRTGGFSSGRGF